MTNKQIKDLLKRNLSEANRKAAILLAICSELGVDYTLIRSAKTRTTMVHIRLEEESSSSQVPALAEIIEEKEEEEELSEEKTSIAPDIKVPRDFENGAKAVRKAVFDSRTTALYCRFRTPGFIQAIDRKWSLPEVMKLASLRRKDGSESPERKHQVRVMSDTLGVSDITKEKPSYKEILCMLSLAKGKNIMEKVKDIFHNFEIGGGKFHPIYFKFASVAKYIGQSEVGVKFLNGEKIDLNQSIRYFVDAFKITEEPSE